MGRSLHVCPKAAGNDIIGYLLQRLDHRETFPLQNTLYYSDIYDYLWYSSATTYDFNVTSSITSYIISGLSLIQSYNYSLTTMLTVFISKLLRICFCLHVIPLFKLLLAISKHSYQVPKK